MHTEEAERIEMLQTVIDNTYRYWEYVETDAYNWLYLTEPQKMAAVFDFVTLEGAHLRNFCAGCWYERPTEAEIIEAYYNAVDDCARDNCAD